MMKEMELSTVFLKSIIKSLNMLQVAFWGKKDYNVNGDNVGCTGNIGEKKSLFLCIHTVSADEDTENGAYS